jgi:hypothetical protein
VDFEANTVNVRKSIWQQHVWPVKTPELQMADNDYATALLIEKIANSPYANSTLIFIIEDDPQDGADHVSANRSTGFIVGPYVKHGAVVSTHYTTVSMLRTMEDVLGLEHLGVQDSGRQPMFDAFDVNQASWTFKATPSLVLFNTQLPLLKTGGARRRAGKERSTSMSAASLSEPKRADSGVGPQSAKLSNTVKSAELRCSRDHQDLRLSRHALSTTL